MTDQMKCPETWVNENNPSDPNLYGRLIDFCLLAKEGQVAKSGVLYAYIKKEYPEVTTQFNSDHVLVNSDGIRWFLSRYPEQFDQFSDELIRKISLVAMREAIAASNSLHAERQADKEKIAALEAQVGQLLARIDELEDKLDEKSGAIEYLYEEGQ